MCHACDIDLYVKVMVTGQDQTNFWSVGHTMQNLLSIFLSLDVGVQHNQWTCREYKNMYIQWQGHRLMSTGKIVVKIRFQTIILLLIIISQGTNLCHIVSNVAR